MTVPSARRPLWLGGVTMALLFGGLGGWAALADLSGAVVAPGQIEVAQNRQVVQHPDGGVVAEIRVAEGAAVQAGDVLIRLDGTLLRSELAIVESQLFEIFARRGRLEAERDDAPAIRFPPELEDSPSPEVQALAEGQRRLFAARAETLAGETEQRRRRLGQIANQIEGIEAQLAALATQTALIEQELADQRSLLDRGLVQAARVLSLDRERARLLGEAGQLTAARAEAQGAMTEIEIEILNLAASRREEALAELRDVAVRELELAERRRALAEQIAQLDIRAPVSGIVLGLTVTTPRAVIRAADPVLYLIPQDRPLVIAARIPTTHVDEVRPGQPVRLVFSSLPAAVTPEVTGTIALVSADALTDERTQAPYYRAEVALDSAALADLRDTQLMPGMPVDAFIETGSRTPLSYLVKPFTDYFNRAWRES